MQSGEKKIQEETCAHEYDAVQNTHKEKPSANHRLLKNTHFPNLRHSPF